MRIKLFFFCLYLVFSVQLANAESVLFSNFDIGSSTFATGSIVGGIDFDDFTGLNQQLGIVFNVGVNDAMLNSITIPYTFQYGPGEWTFEVFSVGSDGLPDTLVDSAVLTNPIQSTDVEFGTWQFTGTTLLNADTPYAAVASTFFQNDGNVLGEDFGEFTWWDSDQIGSTVSQNKNLDWQASDFREQPAIQIEGQVVIPEPSSVAFYLSALLLLMTKRRRSQLMFG